MESQVSYMDNKITKKSEKVLLMKHQALVSCESLMFVPFNDDPATDINKIITWFPIDFLNSQKVFAVKEEKDFLLKFFTKKHESTNKGIRSKGGRKNLLLGEEYFGDTFLACGRCGYWAVESSNVRRHMKNGVCTKEKSYSREDLYGLSKGERAKFLRRMTSARARAKKKARKDAIDNTAIHDITTADCDIYSSTSYDFQNKNYNIQTETAINSDNFMKSTINSNDYVKCDLYSNSENHINSSFNTPTFNNEEFENPIDKCENSDNLAIKKCKRTLKLGPIVEKDVIDTVSFDIFTVDGHGERIGWKPTKCHKCQNKEVCQIVFKGARMRRRCLDLPIPKVLIYRKLDCKTHHCSFTLFHPSVRKEFETDHTAKRSINLKIYSDTVMTHEFYHYISSMFTLKLKPSQISRHLGRVWKDILEEKLCMTNLPEEYRKLITLSKQTVKSICMNQVDSSSINKIFRGSKRKNKTESKNTNYDYEQYEMFSKMDNIRNQHYKTCHPIHSNPTFINKLPMNDPTQSMPSQNNWTHQSYNHFNTNIPQYTPENEYYPTHFPTQYIPALNTQSME